jgi:predicted phosphoribosyltransferase
MVCLEAPSNLMAISLWYQNFYQVEDEQVVELLERARREREERGGANGPEGSTGYDARAPG